ncbi:MAG: hypothetical protein RIC56_05740 [Pseudomonadales bacterium]
MPRSDREIFNDDVTVLVRQLGLELDDLAPRDRDHLLNQARHRHLNDHEAALTLAYDHVPALLDQDVERARVLIDRLALMGRLWRDDDLVHRDLTAPLEREARAQLRRADR